MGGWHTQVLESDDLREALLKEEKSCLALQDSDDAEVAASAAFHLDAIYGTAPAAGVGGWM